MTEIVIHGFTLSLPDDHWLPQILNQLPNYSENLGRIAAAVEQKYPGHGFIDVGANVGDTAAIVCSHSKLPILCIERSEFYYEVLKENVRRLGADVDLECAFGAEEHFERLDAILARHPRFQASKILKIGTNGMDERVFQGALEWIVAARPVLFWGHDVDRDETTKEPGLTIFDRLLDAGYVTALVFDKTGEFIQTISLDARQQLADLSDYLPGGEQFYGYCDICAFHKEDVDLCARARLIELESRRVRRKTSPKPLTEPLFTSAVQAQFERHTAQVTSAVEHTVKDLIGEVTTELTAMRAHAQLDRYRLQLKITDLETCIASRDAEIDRLQAIVRGFLRTEDLKAQLIGLRHELDSSLALRAARSLHWILGPIRKVIGGANGGRL